MRGLPPTGLTVVSAVTLLALYLASAGASDPPVLPIDPFLAYQTKSSVVGPKFVKATGIRLTDSFETGFFDATATSHLLVPASSEGAPIHDSSMHLRAYRIKVGKACSGGTTGCANNGDCSAGSTCLAGAKHVKQSGLSLRHELGEVVLDTVRADLLLLPTLLDATTVPAPPAGHAVDSFKCYLVKETKGRQKFPAGVVVEVADGLAPLARNMVVGAPRHLCVAADVDASGLRDSRRRLVCHKAKPARGEPKHVARMGLWTTTVLGPLAFDTTREVELCFAAGPPGGPTSTPPPLSPTPPPSPTPTPTATPIVVPPTPTPTPTPTPVDPPTPPPTVAPSPTNVPTPTPSPRPLTATTIAVSPSDGESDVSPLREVIVRFSRPLSTAFAITSNQLQARYAGQILPARIVLSSDSRAAHLFFDEPLPSAARIEVHLDASLLLDNRGNLVDVDGDGIDGGAVTLSFTTLAASDIPGTAVWGNVLDAYDRSGGGSGRPVAGATVSVLGREGLVTTTDASGHFVLQGIPSPRLFLRIDGATAINAPPGTRYGSSETAVRSVPGQSVQIGNDGGPFDVFLPPVALGDAVPIVFNATTDVGFGVGARSQLAALFPDIDPSRWDDARVTFAPFSVVDGNGNPVGEATLLPVPADRLPVPLPEGASPRLVVSVDAPGATNFLSRAGLVLPNLEGGLPGETMLLMVLDQDSGRWEIGGTATVSADGQTIASDSAVLRPLLARAQTDELTTATTDPGAGLDAPSIAFLLRGSFIGNGLCAGPEVVWIPPIVVDAFSVAGAVERTSSSDPPAPVIYIEGDPQERLLDQLFYKDDQSFTLVLENRARRNDERRAPCDPVNADANALVVTIVVEEPPRSALEGDWTRPRVIKLLPGESRRIRIAAADLAPLLQEIEDDQLAFSFGPGAHPADELYTSVFNFNLSDTAGTLDMELDLYVARYLDALDAKPQDGVLDFIDTVNDGAGNAYNERSVRILGRRVFLRTVSNHYAINGETTGFEDRILFDPSTNSDGIPGTLSIVRSAGDGGRELGRLNMLGAGVYEEIFVDQPELEQSLEILSFAGSLSTSASEKALLGSASNRERIVEQTIQELRMYLDPQGAGFPVVRSTPTLLTDVRVESFFEMLSSPPGNLALADAVDLRGMIELYELRSSFTRATQNYLMSLALNQTQNRIEVYLDRIFRDFEFDDTEGDIHVVAAVIGLVLAHEVGHSLGLPHVGTPGGYVVPLPRARDDLMLNRIPGQDEIFSRNFFASSSALGFALGLRLEFFEIQEIFEKYYIEFFRNVSAINGTGILSSTGFGTDDGSEDIRFDRGILSLYSEPGGNLATRLDGLEVPVDGSGGQSGQRSYRLENLGDADLHIGRMAVLGDASIQVNPTNLLDGAFAVPAGGSVPFTVTFDPVTAGAVRAEIVIEHDGTVSPTKLDVRAVGRATTSHAVLALETTNVGSAELGSGPLTAIGFARLENRGASPLTVTSIEIVDDGAHQFAISGLPAGFGAGTPLTIAPADAVTFDVSFTPRAIGLQRAEIRVLSNDTDTPDLSRGIVATAVQASSARGRIGDDYVAIRVEGSDTILRARSDRNGLFRLVIPGGAAYELVVFDPETGLVWHTVGVAAPGGSPTPLSLPIFGPSTASDSDGDGLPDDAELAIGTSASEPDTDGDGLDDSTELRRGTDPLAAEPDLSGMVGGSGGGGEAIAICAAGTYAAVTGTSGLTVWDLSDPERPVIGTRFDSHAPTDVACGPDRIYAVDGSDSIRLIEVAEGASATVIGASSTNFAECPGGLEHVTVVGDRAYAAGPGAKIVVLRRDFALIDCTRLAEIEPSTRVEDLAVEGSHLLIALSDTTGSMQIVRTELHPSGVVAPDARTELAGITSLGDTSLAAGAGLAALGRMVPTELSDPEAADAGIATIALGASAIGLVGSPSAIGAGAIAVDERNRALFVDANGSIGMTSIASDRIDAVTATYAVSGMPRDLALHRGLAYVATGDPGLAVVDYLAPDVAGIQPTVILLVDAPGALASAGEPLRLTAAVVEDVGVARVELFTDGVLVAEDGSFPFEFFHTMPQIPGTPVAFLARAVDTAGNVGWSALVQVTTAADVTRPVLRSVFPIDGGEYSVTFGAIGAIFSEPVDRSSLVPASFHVTSFGPDFVFDTDDDVVLAGTISFFADDRRVEVSFPDLPRGRYRAVLDASIRDVAGNALGREHSWTFRVGDAEGTPFAHLVDPEIVASPDPVFAVQAVFDAHPDLATLTPETFQVQSEGDDRVFDDRTFVPEPVSSSDDDFFVPGGVVTYNESTRTASLTFPAPLSRDYRYRLILRPSVADRAGTTLGRLLTLETEVPPDAIAPRIRDTFPADGANAGLVREVQVRFSETVVASTLPGSSLPFEGALRLFEAGADGIHDTLDDLAVPSHLPARSSRYVGSTSPNFFLVLSLPRPLPPGEYRAVVAGSVRDAAFNTLGVDHTWTFRVRSTTVSGQVLDAGGAPIASASVRVHGADCPSGTTTADGRFAIVAVDPEGGDLAVVAHTGDGQLVGRSSEASSVPEALTDVGVTTVREASGAPEISAGVFAPPEAGISELAYLNPFIPFAKGVARLGVFDDGSGPALYAASSFDRIGGIAAPSVARWDGCHWTAVGDQLDWMQDITDMIAFDDGTGPALYLSGRFALPPTGLELPVVRWNGTSWSHLPLVSSFARGAALEVHDDGSGPALYVASETRIGRWDGTAWSFLPDVGPTDAHVTALRSFDDGSGPALIAGGNFLTAGGGLAYGLARWDGQAWSEYGDPRNTNLGLFSRPAVFDLEIFDDGGGAALYVAGSFDTVAGIQAFNIAKRRGATWSGVGGGTTGPVTTLAATSGLPGGPALVAAGMFLQAGPVDAFNLARWDGTSWTGFGTGMFQRLNAFGAPRLGSPRGLAEYDDGTGAALFVAGYFDKVDGVPAQNVARWGRPLP